MWGRRYGLDASARSVGGHRRYTTDDLDRLRRMNAAVIRGVRPAVAATEVLNRQPSTGRRRPGGPGGSVLATPGAGRAARGLARAASRLDEAGATESVLAALREQGTLVTWDEIVRPVLVAAGDHWHRTGSGIEIEHLLVHALAAAMQIHVTNQGKLTQDNSPLLAGGPHEDHVLALHAVRAELAERRVPARLLGSRTPVAAVVSAARRTRSVGALIWLSVPDRVAEVGLVPMSAAHRRFTLLVGGAGWAGLDSSPATLCTSLGEAVARLERAWSDRPATVADDD